MEKKRMIADDDIAEVRGRVRIEDVIGAYVELKPDGSGRLKGLCPFHDERSPSFKVNRDGFYHCFGCQASGDAIAFLMEIDHLTFPEAVQELADKAGVTLRHSVDDGAGAQRRRLFAANEAAQVFYQNQLTSAAAAEAREELMSRGFSGTDAELHGCGYAPASGSALSSALSGEFSREELVVAGLVAKSGRDFFRNRVLWPIRDHTGRVVGFSGRRLSEGDGGKYINTATTPLFHKSRLLYRLDTARRLAARQGKLWIVEGYTDVMAAEKIGLPAVATCGTAFTTDHAALLARHLGEDTNLVFAFDSDKGGRDALLKAWGTTQHLLARCEAALIPPGLDPCGLLNTSGAEATRAALTETMPLTQAALMVTIDTELATDGPVTPEMQSQALKAANALLERTADPVIADGYRGFVADRIGLDESQVPPRRSNLSASGRAEQPATQQRAASGRAGGAGASLEFEFWTAAVNSRDPVRAVGMVEGGWFDQAPARELHRAASYVPAGENWLARLYTAAPETLQPIISRLSAASLDYEVGPETLEHLARAVEISFLERHVEEITESITAAADEQVRARLMGEWEQTLERLATIRA